MKNPWRKRCRTPSTEGLRSLVSYLPSPKSGVKEVQEKLLPGVRGCPSALYQSSPKSGGRGLKEHMETASLIGP